MDMTSEAEPLTSEEEAGIRRATEALFPFGWPHSVRRLLATLDAERAAHAETRKECGRLTDVLLSLHGGEPLTLMDALDTARADLDATRARLADAMTAHRAQEERVAKVTATLREARTALYAIVDHWDGYDEDREWDDKTGRLALHRGLEALGQCDVVLGARPPGVLPEPKSNAGRNGA